MCSIGWDRGGRWSAACLGSSAYAIAARLWSSGAPLLILALATLPRPPFAQAVATEGILPAGEEVPRLSGWLNRTQEPPLQQCRCKPNSCVPTRLCGNDSPDGVPDTGSCDDPSKCAFTAVMTVSIKKPMNYFKQCLDFTLIVTLARSVQLTGTRHPFVVVVSGPDTFKLDPRIEEAFRKADIQVVYTGMIPVPKWSAPHFQLTFGKYTVWGLSQFNKVRAHCVSTARGVSGTYSSTHNMHEYIHLCLCLYDLPNPQSNQSSATSTAQTLPPPPPPPFSLPSSPLSRPLSSPPELGRRSVNALAPATTLPSSFVSPVSAHFTGTHQVVNLDTDMLVVKNIDHLFHVPTPAFVSEPGTRSKCTMKAKCQNKLAYLNSGLMVTTPYNTKQEYDKMIKVIIGKQGKTSGWDKSDQGLLLKYLQSTKKPWNELPSTYNQMACGVYTALHEYSLASVWHFNGLKPYETLPDTLKGVNAPCHGIRHGRAKEPLMVWWKMYQLAVRDLGLDQECTLTETGWRGAAYTARLRG